MITITTASTTKEIGESILFQPVLKAYPTCHSWIIAAHVSLGHLECHWKYFNRHMDKTCQLLLFLSHHPTAPTHLLSPLQVELDTINDMYDSCKPSSISAINLLNTDPSFDGHMNRHPHSKRSLLPFLGDALQWLTGIATTKDVSSIKAHVNQLIETQSTQQDTLVHIVSILNITRYASQVNRHSINILMDKVDEMSERCQHPVQLEYFVNHWPHLSTTSAICQVSSGKPARFTILYCNSFYTHHGLLRCSYNRDTFPTYSTNNGFWRGCYPI